MSFKRKTRDSLHKPHCNTRRKKNIILILEESDGDEVKSGDVKAGRASAYNYRLKLNFATKVFGAFKQTLIFDFGTKQPLLAKVRIYN